MTEELLSPGTYYALAFVYIVLAIAATFFNSVVLLTFIMDRSLVLPANVLIMSIATSDWLMGVMINPLGAAANASESAWFTDSTCTFYAFVSTFLGLGTMLHHAAYALDRYFVLSRPLESQHSMGRMVTVVLSIWGFALMWSLFPLFGWSAYVPEAGRIACSLRWQSAQQGDTFFVICLFAFFYIIPLSVIVISYTLMFVNVRYMTKNARKIWGNNAAATLETIKAAWKMAKIGLLMFIGFFVAWTPYAAVSFYAAFLSTDFSLITAAFPAMFAKTSNIYNPIIYFFAYKTFRESLLKLWRRYRNRNTVMPLIQSSNVAFVVSSATRTRHHRDSTTIEEITL
ncbi:melanopsin-B-like [Stylophora pistillata]|uniref:melanopsin-B-like n=1 Tax=Stylophora pistillata TaxID=50429 RepID=UPI000C04FCF1|nr:melanopsin-B-like [Stylophora pistillata]XP_022809288.1 melanopsin-B-like [Stylophora pistillata]